MRTHRPNKAKTRLRHVLNSPKKTKPMNRATMPGSVLMIGNATETDKRLFASNHAVCAMAHMTPETTEGITIFLGMYTWSRRTVMYVTKMMKDVRAMPRKWLKTPC